MKIGVGLLVVAAALMLAVFRPGVPQDSSEAALQTVGGITAAPSGLPGLPAVINQVLPAIAPASGPGAQAVVGAYCDAAFPTCPTDVNDVELPLDFTITRVWPPGAPAARFPVGGGTSLVCLDGAACDLEGAGNVVAVQVNGGGVNEVVQVTACDRSSVAGQAGDCRRANIIFVETIFAVAPVNSGTAIAASIVSYRCPDVGRHPDGVVPNGGSIAAFDDWWNTTMDPIPVFVGGPALGSGLDFFTCGGDTASPVDDRVNFETDEGILTVEEAADIDQGLEDTVGVSKEDAVTNECDAGDSVDVLDNPNVWAGDDSQECDLDGAPNGVVSYGLLGTGDVGVATVTAQQSGGGGVLRTINVTFAGAAALSLFIDAPESVGLTGGDFNVAIVDQDGRPISGETVQCSVSPVGGALLLLPQTGTSDGNGIVDFMLVPTGASVVGGEELTITCFLDSNPDVRATATVNLSMTPEVESVDLVVGCTPVASTWDDGTAIGTVADAVSPADGLEGIWAFDAATSTWEGYSPDAPAAANDLTSVDQLEPIFICMSEAGSVSRPVI